MVVAAAVVAVASAAPAVVVAAVVVAGDPQVTAGRSDGAGPVPAPEEHVRRTVLDNGLRVVTDAQPASRSVSVSVWVGVGGRDEPDELAGASHVLEHLLFKGTAERDARSIALDLDAVGGDMNAFTANEHTAFYARVPAGAADLATGLLLDVVSAPALRPEELDAEREVILEELAAAEDDPDDVAVTHLFEGLFPGHPLGREVLGTRESLGALGREEVAGFLARWYCPTNLVVAAAGQVDHDELVRQVSARLGDRAPGEAPVRTAPDDHVVGEVTDHRPVETTHLALGWRTMPASDPGRFALAIANHLLGGGPSSRLFQEVREQRGLTYGISSSVSAHVDAGALSVHVATSPRKVDEVQDVMGAVIADLVARGITEDELARAKGSLRGGLLLGLEDTASRMTRLGIGETMRGGVTPVDEHLARLDAVTVEDVHAVLRVVLGRPRVRSVVSPDGRG
ncbi:MAG: M16 family metallopeptidase [Microthrixaceae bacterium]